MTKNTLKKAAEKQRKLLDLGLNIVDVEPWVPCKIGDKVYKLEYNYPATVEIFQKIGIAVGVDELQSGEIIKNLASILLAGLRTHHSDEFGEEIDPDTEAAVERNLMRRISMRHLLYYTTVINKAMTAVQPDPEQLADILGEDLEPGGSVPGPLAVVPTSEDSGLNAENSDVLTLGE